MSSRLLTCASVFGILMISANCALAQTTTNNIDAPNNATSTANPAVDLNQQGSLVNTQVNTHPLGRSIVGRGVADCTSNGIAFSAFGNGIGPFDTGTLGGSFTYTHSFGMGTCNEYAQTQLSKAKLENCLLLISNYSKMVKAGVKVSYQALKTIGGVDCPPIAVQSAVAPTNGPLGRNAVPAPQNHRPQPILSHPEQPEQPQPLPQHIPPNHHQVRQQQNPHYQHQHSPQHQVPVATPVQHEPTHQQQPQNFNAYR
ncbi:hypothetical protein [Acaryochloris sp. IP29b_bin.137]|uniref:hypothetical protein n=1 Tax=Acaryochloris sp. IP29b_bin.137 TaxID=2969217 RepID=UPI002617F492|nr:hypothetical protein [Acaryochloris sp. IP29b_bin.137]